MTYSIHEVAKMAHCSVRALHHYDRIGLFKPAALSPAGYRVYHSKDLEQLQQILFLKEMDFGLDQIKRILHTGRQNRISALQSHQGLLIKKKERLEKIIRTLEKTIRAAQGGKIMKNEDLFSGFDLSAVEAHKQKYAEEVQQRYGSSAAYAESEKKTARYGKADWARISAEGNALFAQIAEWMDLGPSHAKVQKAVARWQQHITDYFYTCTPEIFRGLGELYASDPRFTKNIDKIKPGLARFLREAMQIYCDHL